MKIAEHSRLNSGQEEKVWIFECSLGHVYGWTIQPEEEPFYLETRLEERLSCPQCHSLQLQEMMVSLQRQAFRLLRERLRARIADRRVKALPIEFSDRRRIERRAVERRGAAVGL